MSNMLQVDGLSARRGRKVVFREVSFALDAGDVLLVTGGNGSGKSSLLRVLAGLLPVVEGSICWHEEAIDNDPQRYRQQLHYVGHLDALKPELTVGEMIAFWQALAGRSEQVPDADPFRIMTWRDTPTRYLSAGQKRRLALTRVALWPAPLWLLDEPTTALDHAGQELLFSSIAQHRKAGGVAVIATHQSMPIPDAKHYTMAGGMI